MKSRKNSSFGIIFLMVFVLCFSGMASGSETNGGGGFAIRLYGAFNYLKGGDINEGMKGIIDYWKYEAEGAGYISQGEYKPLNYGIDLGGDLIFQFTPNIGIGFGTGYLQSTKETVIDLTLGSEKAEIRDKPSISAIPLKASLFFFFPLGSALNMTLNVGAAYYLAKVDSTMRIGDPEGWLQYEMSADGKGLGYHGGIGFEIRLSPSVSLILEGTGRYAKIRGFKGKAQTLDSDGVGINAQGKLYFWIETDSGKEYAAIYITEEKPTGSWVKEVREAVIDFSGGSILAGLLFRF
jgi:hypothetical protein